MSEFLLGVASSITSKIAELLVKPTISQFRYLFCFKSIVDELKAEEKDLAPKMTRVREQVNTAKNNAEVIEKDVEEWMADTKTAMKEVQCLKDEIQQDKRCFNKRCPNWLWRYRLGKKAAKKTKVLKEFAEKGKFTTVSHPAPLQDIKLRLSKYLTPSKSSREALNQIMNALKDDNISIIGLYGMGGVGKTTLAKEVANKVKELELFDEVVFVVVSKNQVLSNIQHHMAEKLGVKFDKKDEQEREKHLGLRLKDEKKKLVILDDVWKNLKLEDIGVSDDNKNCKILLTTRLRQVCIGMDCQSKIHLDVLKEDEAWALFKKNAGLRDDQLDLHQVAMKVAEECKGLPIAIVTVGKAMKEKENLREWQVALDKLKNSRLPEIRGIDEYNAYTCLKFSFDELHREETRLCLFLCSLFPEDSEIFVEDLVGYAIGLNLYKAAQTVENTRNEVLDAIADLKDSCMLPVTEKEGYVKMHDMVRDCTLWIGSQAGNEFTVKTYAKFSEWQSDQKSEDYKAISIMGDAKEDFSNGFICPKLELLLVLTVAGWRYNKVEYNFFQEMKQLKVVSLAKMSLSTHSLEFLNNLRVLELVDCKINYNFGPTLMMLKRLQILRCRGLFIEELLNEGGELKNLKVLDLQDCGELRRISSGKIQKLSKLEELSLRNCSNLKCIFSPSLARSLLHLQNLRVESCGQLKHIISVTEMEEETTLSEGKIVVGNDLKLSNLISIYVSGCPSLEYVFPTSLAAQGLSCLEEISILDNYELKSVFENETNNIFTSTTFNLQCYTLSLPKWKSLRCCRCPQFLVQQVSKIWILQKPSTYSKQLANGSPAHIIQPKFLELDVCGELEHVITIHEKDRLLFKSLSKDQLNLLRPWFSNLSRIEISNCYRLKSLFPITLLILDLPSLSKLEIIECSELVEVFDEVEDKADENIIQQEQIYFQKLSSLTLVNLPSLVNFCPLSYHFIFRSLERLEVKGCPKITTIFTIAPDKVVHSKTKAPEEASLSTSVNIYWKNKYELQEEQFKLLGLGLDKMSELPPYLEEEAKPPKSSRMV